MTTERRNDVIVAAALFALALVVFLASPVVLFTDSKYTLLTSECLTRHLELRLDRYVAAEGAYQLVEIDGHVYSWYPAGSALLSAPFVLTMRVAGLSCIRDGRYDEMAERRAQRILAALLMAALAVVFFVTARQFLALAPGVAVAAGGVFGTQVWSTASRELWSDTWGILLVAGAILVLVTRPRPVLLAVLLALAVFARPANALPAVALGVYLAKMDRAAAIRYAVALAIGIVLPWAIYHPVYGQLQPDFHPAYFSLETMPSGLAGVLFSPSRGLVWSLPIVVALPFLLRREPLVLLAAGIVVAHMLVIACWSCWWGGHGYGSRLATGIVPWVVLLVILAVRTQRGRRVPVACLAGLALVGVAMHARGATSEATNRWNLQPVTIDEDPSRFWDLGRPQFLAGLQIQDRGPDSASYLDRARRAADADAALAILDQGLARHPRAVNLLLKRGELHASAGRPSRALDDFRAALDVNTHVAPAWWHRGLVRASLGEDTMAIEDFGRALRLDRRFAQALVCRAVSHGRLGQHAEAVADLLAYVRLRPRDAGGYAELGAAHMAREDGRAAIESFDRAVALDGNQPRTYLGRAQARERTGDMTGAIADFERFVRLAPEAPMRGDVLSHIDRLKSRK